MTTHTLALAAVVATLAATPAAAQDAPPRIEIGIVGSGLMILPVLDGPLAVVGGGPSMTIGITPRLRLDVRAQIIGPNEGSGVHGLYEALVRFPIGGSQGGRPALSMTAGAAGSFSYYRSRDYRVPQVDGSVVVYPARRDLRATLPRIASVGIAHQRPVSRRLSMVLAADGLAGAGALVARGTIGLSFGVGR